ncbi:MULTISPECIES: hypothetical protein [Afipia]|uniref:thiolase family protein n=1 Tax=Afipia TaxID=1033 RepID=UPI0009DA5C7D|nr:MULTISPECIES: hypothetical protein [Afipia]
MAHRAEPNLVVWGNVIPNLGWSNVAREVWLDAKLNPNVPAFSVVLACSTSMTAAFAAAGMLGSGIDLTLVGGAEVMSRPPIALTSEASKRLTDLFGHNPAAALAALRALEPKDYVLPNQGMGQSDYRPNNGRAHGRDREGVAHQPRGARRLGAQGPSAGRCRLE